MKVVVSLIIFLFAVAAAADAQTKPREFKVAAARGGGARIEIENRFGKVRVVTDERLENKILLEQSSPNGQAADNNLTVQTAPEKISLVVRQTDQRLDLTVRVPSRSRVTIVGADGEIEVAGNLASADVATDTGTIYADVPPDALRFDLLWTESRPRYLSDFEIPDPKEKGGGKFEIAGKIPNRKNQKSKIKNQKLLKPRSESTENGEDDDNAEAKNQRPPTGDPKSQDKLISLNFTTKRGVILLNVPPSEVPSDLRPRPLTNAAKAIVKSGDSILSEAIRRASPKYFGDYLKNLPERHAVPRIVPRETPETDAATATTTGNILRRLNLSVADRNGRAINNLTAADFGLLENNEERAITGLEPTSAPFNLVLLLDVSGSVEERIDFIRKAARNFVKTVGKSDRLAIITFRDDIQVVSKFTTDKNLLSQSLDTFDAGGGTALYDSIAYVLADTLRPLKGERTAIVILSDGDDNRSFIPFEPLLGAIQESGALVYPLYVPSGLIPFNGQSDSTRSLDPLRSRYLTLTTRAEAEGKQLAEISGGVYFPIRRLEDLQTAYEDVIAQLRTAYSLTYRSKIAAPGAPRVRVHVKREGAFVRAGGAPVEVKE